MPHITMHNISQLCLRTASIWPLTMSTKITTMLIY